MIERKRIVLLILIMTFLSLMIVGITIAILYNASFESQKDRFIVIALFFTFIIVLVGTYLFVKITHPMIKQLENYNEELEQRIIERTSQLTSLQQQHFAFFNLSPELSVVTTFPEGRIIEVNESFERTTGFKRDEVIGHTVFDLDVWLDLEDHKKVFQILKEKGIIHNFETLFKKKSGEIVPVLFSMTLIEIDGKKLTLSMLNDISKRKQIEEILGLHSEILHNMSEGVNLISAKDALIVYANPQFERMFGYDAGELIGKPVTIINASGNKNSETIANEIVSSLMQNGMWSGEIHNIKKDGTTFWCNANVSAFEHPRYGRVWISVHEDITERKQAEAAMMKTLSEKEVLLREVHHRVKNNMASIIGIIRMQRQSINDPSTITALTVLNSRIMSMSIIHEKLYQSKNLSMIDFHDYLNTLIPHVDKSFDKGSDIRFIVDAKGVEMVLDHAIPCGLIVNELLTNAIKYAFPEKNFRSETGSTPEISVTAECNEGAYTLTVSDNGIGLPADIDLTTTKSLGLHLVGMIGQHQLGGSIKIDRAGGTKFILKF